MTDYASALVARYRSLMGQFDDTYDVQVKVNIIRVFDDCANHPEVSRLLLDILCSRDEYFEARAEAMLLVRGFVNESSKLEAALNEQIWKIFADTSEDLDVREHAVVRRGFGGSDEFQIVERILFDDDEPEEVRRIALRYLSHADHQFVSGIIPRLRNHAYWGRPCFAVRLANLSARCEEQW